MHLRLTPVIIIYLTPHRIAFYKYEVHIPIVLNTYTKEKTYRSKVYMSDRTELIYIFIKKKYRALGAFDACVCRCNVCARM